MRIRNGGTKETDKNRGAHIRMDLEMKPYILLLRIVSYQQGNEAIRQLQCKEAIDATAFSQ
jgi:hypothetical protein